MANKLRAKELLKDITVKTSKSKEKDYTLRDGGGLSLLIRAFRIDDSGKKFDGSKLWEVRYTLNGKPKRTTLGTYPEITLARAREKALEHIKASKDGIDLVATRKSAKIENISDKNGLFHLVCYEWLKTLDIAPITLQKKTRNFERDIFSKFCKFDSSYKIISSPHISSIEHDQIYDAIKAKEAESKDTARRLLNDLNEVWLYAINKKYVSSNIISNISKKSLAKHDVTHHPKITNPATLKELMEAIDGYGGVMARYALKFVMLNPYRAMNLGKDKFNNDRALEWSMVDFEKSQIVMPRDKMKTTDKNFDDFIMPLSAQSVVLLKELREITGWGKWLFHGDTDTLQPMNKETPNRALERLGFNDEAAGRKIRLHGFRGTFRSIAETYEHIHGVNEKAMEAALDHHESDIKKRAYKHKADYTEQGRKLMQWWADYLDTIKNN